QLNGPFGVAVAGSGDVYVADSSNNRIAEYSQSGSFVRAFGKDVGGTGVDVCTTSCVVGSFGGGAGQLGGPAGVGVAGSGDVYVAEFGNRITEFSQAGSFVRAFGKNVGGTGVDVCTTSCSYGSGGGGAGQLNSPNGVAVAGSGDVYVADQSNNRIAEWGRATAPPTLATTATASASVGSPISDTATLTGGNSPTGTITFKAYDNSTCSGTPVFSPDPVTVVSGAGSSGDFKPTKARSYYWTASYSGDSGNDPVTSACNLDPSETSTVTDTTAPTVTLTAPADGTATNDSSPTFAGTGGTAYGDSATVTVKIWSGSSVGSGNPDYTVSTTRDSSTGAYSRSGPYTKVSDSSSHATLPDGTYTAQAFQSDASGNTGNSSASTFTLDTAAPATSDDVPAGFVNHDVTVTLTATDTGGSGVDKTYYTTGQSPADPTTGSSVYNPGSKPTLANGEQIKYFSTDKAGNSEAVQTSPAAQVDTAKPSSSASAPAFSNNSSTQVDYTASDNSGGSGLGSVDLYVKGPNDSAYSKVDTDPNPATSGHHFTYAAGEGDGNYSFYTRATDKAGNTEDAPATPDGVTVALDTAKPSSSASSPAFSNGTSIQVDYAADGTGSGLDKVELYVKAPGQGSYSKAATDSTPAATGHHFTYAASSGDGDYGFYTVAYDKAGNTEDVPASADSTTTLDTAAPSTSDDVPTAQVNHDVTVTLTATDTGGSGVDKTYYETGTSPADPTTASSAYDASSKPVLHDGEQIKYFSTDKAGNAEGVKTSATADVSAPAAKPVVATGAASGVTAGEATLHGTVNPEGDATGYHFEYGTSTGYGQQAPASDAPVGSDSTDHAESVDISGLAPGTTYHFRIVATNSAGPSNGSDQIFTTSAAPSAPAEPAASAPGAMTLPASDVGRTTATALGSVNPNGQATSYHFDYGTSVAYGTTTPDQSAGGGSSTQPATAALTGLARGTTYHYRIVATNSAGSTSGGDQTFTTQRSPTPALAGRLRLSHRDTHTNNGVALIRVRCEGVQGARCNGNLRLQATRYRSRHQAGAAATTRAVSFDHSAGETKLLRVKLPAATAAQLSTKHKAVVRAVITAPGRPTTTVLITVYDH
ncbi:MAG: hypothetical protein QOJ12_1834, partial [Thermoleophilales bacterium]|nr:hypothetical protein [Thermoleophilales bacterium]